jgi:myo-inositol 2-dehydrogenase/D-chiro-inositol 1-dehydrogenase
VPHDTRTVKVNPVVTAVFPTPVIGYRSIMPLPSALRLAVVGTGAWAQKVHYPTLAYLSGGSAGAAPFVLRGVCSLDVPTAAELASRYGFARVYRTIDELIADPEVDVIAVIVMPGLLPELLSRLQAKGVPLLTEKPPGVDSVQAARLAATIRVPHVVSFNRRFVPLVTRLREEVAKLDGPVFVEGRFYRHARLDPDFIRGTGIHLINTLEYVFGPVASARTTRRPHPRAATLGWLTDLEFASGLAGRAQFLPCTGMQVEQIEVHSASRSLVLEIPAIGSPGGRLDIYVTGSATEATSAAPGDLPPCGSVGGYQALFAPTTVESVREAPGDPAWRTCGFANAYEHLAAVAAGRKSLSTFADSVTTMQLAEAIESGTDYRAGSAAQPPPQHVRQAPGNL